MTKAPKKNTKGWFNNAAKTINVKTSDTFSFGVVSDNHLGSKSERLDILREAYQDFKKSGINIVFNPGDIVDGENMYRGQVYELHTQGASGQANYFMKHYPKAAGITTYGILGNHPESFHKRSGIYFADLIKKREDFIVVAPIEADIMVGSTNKCDIRLFHPRKGTAYAISYQPQKIVESYSGGDKPEILLIGHFHKASYNFIRNVHVFQSGTTEDQTSFMREQYIEAHRGYWKIQAKIDKTGGIEKIINEFTPYYN
jgi:predicted phosphodiesterase